MSYFLGVDPGNSGALVALDARGDFIGWIKASETLHDVSMWLANLECTGGNGRALLESVSSSPQMGVRSAFTFGRSLGNLEALLASHRVKYKMVAPSKWQSKMSCRTKGDKNVTKKRAQQLWPTQTITHANADASLLAELCRTKWEEV